MKPEEQVRADFEAMCAEKNYRLSPDQNNCGIVVPERYGHPTVQRMWEAYRAAYAQARRDNQSNDLMAECMHMVHTDLIAAGVVSESVPPMMVPEAVMRAIGKARREALEEAAECLRLHAIGHFTLLEAERALEQLIKD